MIRFYSKNKVVIAAIGWSAFLFFISHAAFVLSLDFIAGLFGGPIEPPAKMKPEDFFEWVHSGRWWKEDVQLCAKTVGISFLVATILSLGLLIQKRPPKI